MFEQNGLSLEQAPPISVIMGLFLFGGLWGVLSGISVVYYGESIFDPASIGAVVTTHLLTLGVMMSFMLGALFQMLPVVAGIILENPAPKSNLLKILLILGLTTLLFAFVTKVSFLFIFSSIFLGASLLYISFVMSTKLIRLSNHSASSRGMLFSTISLSLLTLMALYMTTAYAQMHDGIYFLQIKHMHYTYALFGWITLLIISISFQSIEMFYVAPPYPIWLSRYLPISILSLLVLSSISLAVDSKFTPFIESLIYLLYAGYGGLTLVRLSQRKRPLADATVWFWRLGMGSLIMSMLLLTFYTFVNQKLFLDVSIVLFASFVSNVLFAMFYKIVPFLTWFHLNAQGYLSAPMMHEVIHPKTAKRHMWVHLFVSLSFLASIVVPSVLYLSGSLLLLSFAITVFHIINATRLYRYTLLNGEKFEF